MTLAATAIGLAAISLSVWSLVETARTQRIWRKINALKSGFSSTSQEADAPNRAAPHPALETRMP